MGLSNSVCKGIKNTTQNLCVPYLFSKNDSIMALYPFKFNNKMNNMTSLPFQLNFKNVFSAITWETEARKITVKTAKTPYTANLIFFENLTYIENNILKIPQSICVKPEERFIFGLAGSDKLAGKERLCNMMDNRGKGKWLPKTYQLPSELEHIINASSFASVSEVQNSPQLYILKSNVQRQKGNVITNNIDYIKHHAKSYVVCQEVLRNPLVVGKRKINIRIYLLIIVKPTHDIEAYIYNDGFMYYAPEFWDPLSTNSDVHITTGYIDREVYTYNPLTFKDLAKELGKEAHEKLLFNIVNASSDMMSCYREWFIEKNRGIPGTKFCIFGCDFAPDSKLDVKIMEVNKGPDLSYKDERDKAVKFEMMKEMMESVTLGSTYKNFILLK